MRCALRQKPGCFAERLDFRATARAGLEVPLELRALRGVEAAQCVGRGEVCPAVLGHGSTCEIRGLSASRSFSMAARSLVFTVPSGSFSSAAISLCDSPPK